jgi:SAM-dependent methyltransferase
MLDIAMRRAKGLGITNVETTVCSADDLPFGDWTFDSVSVRFGYMFFPDLARATGEFARVLEPGGRSARRCGSTPVRTRGRRSSRRASRPRWTWRRPTPTGRPCSDAPPAIRQCPVRGRRAARRGRWNVDIELVTQSPEQYWEMMSEHVSLAATALRWVDDHARRRIAKAVIDKVSTYEEGGAIRVPGVARCIVGTK